MGILTQLLDGVNAADVGVLLALVWLVVRLEWTRSENAAAHDSIAKNISGVKQDLNQKIDDFRQDLTKDISGVKQDLNQKIDDFRQDLTRDISGVKQDLTKDISGVKQDLTRKIDDVGQDVKKLLTGDVAWMQAVLQDRQRRE